MAPNLPTVPNFFDFQLPGIKRGGHKQIIVGLAHAHSSNFNRRRLEGHAYAPWDLLLNGMVHDMQADTFVAAQYCLDGRIAALDASVMTDAGKGTSDKQYTPDFTIIIAIPVLRSAGQPWSLDMDQDLTNWEDVSILYTKTPTLAELKRPPPRRPETLELFTDALNLLLRQAQRQLMLQVSKAFESNPDLTKVALMAVSGAWWTWRIITRAAQDELKSTVTKKTPLPGELAQKHLPVDEISDSEESDTEEEEDSEDEFLEVLAKGKQRAVPLSDRAIRPNPPVLPKYQAPKQKKLTMNDVVAWHPPAPENRGRKPKNNEKKGSTDPDEASSADKQPGTSTTTTGPEKKVKKKFPVQHYKDLGEQVMEFMNKDSNKVKEARTEEWSGVIYLGSPVSNQAMALIHGLIEDTRGSVIAQAVARVADVNDALAAAAAAAEDENDDEWEELESDEHQDNDQGEVGT
ncbi:hypothetical protein Hypma_007337 [Hypsizygus marmoreus]|uniref:Uncharacterized protein n=1 Tax=Hypsizygus marmoreus TaxID=39966 RepID=A0A369JU02_HYPMA|nr:hypothetical protein Hypma_007337 [Hypsizygus marmoreus]